MHSYPEIGSSSNASTTDQHNLHINPIEAQNLPGYLFPSGDSHMLYGERDSHENVNFIEGGQRMEVGGSEETDMLRFGNRNLNLNISQIDYNQPLQQNHNTENANINFFPEEGDHHSSCKRKSIDGIQGQSSTPGSSSHLHHSGDRLLLSTSPHNATGSNLHLPSSSTHPCLHPPVEESLLRNTRMRIDLSQSHISPPNPNPNPFPQVNSSSANSNNWPTTHQPSPSFIPVHDSEDSMLLANVPSSYRHPPLPSFPNLPQAVHPFPPSGTSNLRIGSSSSSLEIAGEQSTSEESSSSRQSSSTGRRNTPQNCHRLAEILRRSMTSPNGGPRERNRSVLPPRHRSFTPYVVGTHQSEAVLPDHHQPFVRSAPLINRHNDGHNGVPLSVQALAAAREERSRMLSEIRNMLEFVRRQENLRLEDVLFFDRSGFFGGADLHDRHRDMRLDVDNMSYEELLALEERIGNVSTGLSEEKIMNHLKQRKYFSLTLEPLAETEPCCICREEYVEGDELGRLDCGHDFHTACIKQWLVIKNLCPICKNTALNS
ncbi:probable E3 ubiquitin-protein ligase HIP1 [Ananas comosus]|uniref:RING-type E3 ubiquitin transferase n=2 Tax=Ananas comosus TaxID=4615 RepID=A0A6P5G3E4_ANACO|nr:probable E3 ubiquitin-protein ligase HIP1 [Ananas comosus]CAD1823133.1 unnamed protein product [Ananas comosus var. bracteatus]